MSQEHMDVFYEFEANGVLFAAKNMQIKNDK